MTGPAVLAAVSGRSAAGPVRPVPDIRWRRGLIASAIEAELACFMTVVEVVQSSVRVGYGTFRVQRHL